MIAVYAGTFDPMTFGHLSVVSQAASIFSFVRVLVADNPDKRVLFTVAQRVALIKECVQRMPNVSVDSTDGFVVTYAQQIGARFLVRGIRGASDATFETTLAQQNRALAADVQTVLLPAESRLSDVSSSALKQAALRGQDLHELCPPNIAAALVQQLHVRGAA